MLILLIDLLRVAIGVGVIEVLSRQREPLDLNYQRVTRK
jgi:hypothetical protein